MRALPPLPEPFHPADYLNENNLFSAAQMHSYALAATAPLEARIAELERAIDAIRQYGSDTLSGRVYGPADAAWYREGVREMTRRARVAMKDHP